jgi:hypothetical protein
LDAGEGLRDDRTKLEQVRGSLMLSSFPHPYGVKVGRRIACGLFDRIRLPVNFHFVAYLRQHIQLLRAYERIVSCQSELAIKHAASFALPLGERCVVRCNELSASRFFDVDNGTVGNDVGRGSGYVIGYTLNHYLFTSVGHRFQVPGFQNRVIIDTPEFTFNHRFHLFPKPSLLVRGREQNMASRNSEASELPASADKR